MSEQPHFIEQPSPAHPSTCVVCGMMRRISELEATIERVRAEVLREAADDIDVSELWDVDQAIGWLRARADAEEGVPDE